MQCNIPSHFFFLGGIHNTASKVDNETNSVTHNANFFIHC